MESKPRMQTNFFNTQEKELITFGKIFDRYYKLGHLHFAFSHYFFGDRLINLYSNSCWTYTYNLSNIKSRKCTLFVSILNSNPGVIVKFTWVVCVPVRVQEN